MAAAVVVRLYEAFGGQAHAKLSSSIPIKEVKM